MVTMSHKATLNTAMLAHCERLLDSRSALRTILRSERSRYFPYPSASTFSLALEYLKKSIPCRITDGFGKVMVLHHALNVQIFNANIVKLSNDLISKFVKEIPALIGYSLMFASKYTSGFVTIRAAQFLLAYLALRYLQLPFRPAQIFRIFYYLASRERSEVFNANIYAYTLAGSRDIRRVVFFNRKDTKPAIHLPLDCHSLDFTFNLTRQPQPDRTNFTEIEFVAFKFPAALWKGETVITRRGFEARQSHFIRALFDSPKEILKSSFEPLQHILQYLRMYLSNVGTDGFDGGQFKALGCKAQRTTRNAVGITTFLKRGIVQLSAHIKGSLKLALNSPGGLQFKLVRFQRGDYITKSVIVFAGIHPAQQCETHPHR